MDKRLADVAANETPVGMQTLYASFSGEDGRFSCEYLPDVTYAEYGDVRLKLQIIRPSAPGVKLPLVVFVQGSGWRKQAIYSAIPSLSWMASRGYVIASVQYRDTDMAPFPAQLEDVKAAIRFMRANAEEYSVDPERVAVWGDSSGGHVALMTGMTDGLYRNDVHSGYSDDVAAVVDFYGITDILSLGEFNDILDHDAADSPEALLLGGRPKERAELAREASPLYRISDQETPPVLLVHGDEDEVVHINQSIRFYKAMRDAGKRVFFYKVVGGGHGPGVWCEGVLAVVDSFLSAQLKRPR